MKKLMFAFALVLMLCGSAFATVDCFNAKGSLLVADVHGLSFESDYYQNTSFTLSNITSTAVTCRVTVYDQNGDDISSNGNVYVAGNSANLINVSTSGTFEIPANSTRIYKIQNSNTTRFSGYAVIEWTSDSEKQRKALIAGMYTFFRSRSEKFTWGSQLNNGQPF
ncbi:hypothetical protein [Salidesulfovibrio onnuriiensis]|uniref:hypothetical protein n=1 Tax=Salidesulfovibrio onnuriiensis TaxID=2583823 RepID=UPI0011CAC339|nr:hypothetical protein [Salidesulfovibrio onnuriiensis]